MTDDAITEARRLCADEMERWTLRGDHYVYIDGQAFETESHRVAVEIVTDHVETIKRLREKIAALLSATGAAEARGTEQVNVPDDGRLSKLCEREHWYRRGCPGLDDGSDYAISGDMAIDVADDLSAAIDLIEDERLAHQETRGAVAAWKQEGEKLRARVTALEQELTATGAILDECEARIMAESARATGRRTLDRIGSLGTHPKPFIYVRPLAVYLDCDPRTILRMIHTDQLRAIRVGREWKIPTSEAQKKFHVATHQSA